MVKPSRSCGLLNEVSLEVQDLTKSQLESYEERFMHFLMMYVMLQCILLYYIDFAK